MELNSGQIDFRGMIDEQLLDNSMKLAKVLLERHIIVLASVSQLKDRDHMRNIGLVCIHHLDGCP